MSSNDVEVKMKDGHIIYVQYNTGDQVWLTQVDGKDYVYMIWAHDGIKRVYTDHLNGIKVR